MGISKLECVMWRLRKAWEKEHPGNKNPTNHELRRAIMYECGTDPSTYRNNRKALMILGWIKPYNKKRVTLTGKDITG